jgi:transposase
MPMLAGRVDFVIGVDTHKQSHTAAAVDALGGVHQVTSSSTDSAGYRRLLAWAQAIAPGRRAWAVEGTGSFGAGLTVHLLEAGEWVCEIDRPTRPARKAGAKSDQIDAIRAAREALARQHLAQPRRRGEREAIRVLKVSRRQAVRAQGQALNQLKALVVNAPDELRARLRGLPAAQLLRSCARLHLQGSRGPEWRATVIALRATAQRAQMAEAEVEQLERELAELVSGHTELIAEMGVGTVGAAQLLASWSHRGRFRSEAAFANLGGSAPIPASSGQVIRHRLNRAGDRELNCTLRTVVITRLRHDPRTQAYRARRRAEGKSDREIQRCLKRYIARHLFRVMERSESEQTNVLA